MNELLQKSLEYLNSTETFLHEQVPGFIHQYLSWCAFECIFYIILWGMLFLILFVAFLITNHKLEKSDFNCYVGPKTTKGYVWCISIFMGAIAIISILVSSYTLLKINKAPKVFLVEKLAAQLKK